CLESGPVRFGGRPRGKGPAHLAPRRAADPTQAAKGQAGLGHYQVRHWTAWHRHITLAMLVLAFLAALAAEAAPTRSAKPNRPVRSTDPIDLTVPEIRHLLGALLNSPNTSPDSLLRWSDWRRRHQSIARRCHYRRRLLAPSSG
ncbi:hypothetical protein ACFYXB_41880, partial [Streptomyces sp. NPDC002619]